MLSFAHIMNHEATESLSMTACAGARKCKLPSAPGEVPVEVLSDRGSIPLISTKTRSVEPFWKIAVIQNVFALIYGIEDG
jgi:hypothetical protein